MAGVRRAPGHGGVRSGGERSLVRFTGGVGRKGGAAGTGVVLWVRVQRAGGAGRGEEGELQGIGERARGQAGGDARAW